MKTVESVLPDIQPEVLTLLHSAIESACDVVNDMSIDEPDSFFGVTSIREQAVLMLQVALDPTDCNIQIPETLVIAMNEIIDQKLQFSLKR